MKLRRRLRRTAPVRQGRSQEKGRFAGRARRRARSFHVANVHAQHRPRADRHQRRSHDPPHDGRARIYTASAASSLRTAPCFTAANLSATAASTQHRRELLLHPQAWRDRHLSPLERGPHAPLHGRVRFPLPHKDDHRPRARRQCRSRASSASASPIGGLLRSPPNYFGLPAVWRAPQALDAFLIWSAPVHLSTGKRTTIRLRARFAELSISIALKRQNPSASTPGFRRASCAILSARTAGLLPTRVVSRIWRLPSSAVAVVGVYYHEALQARSGAYPRPDGR